MIKIEKAEKQYFCIFCGASAQWTALFDAGDGVMDVVVTEWRNH